MTVLNQKGQQLAQHLQVLYRHQTELTKAQSKAETVNVVGAGGALTAAYEQLRNAAENTEEHLLLQNAIRRFFKQLFITRDESVLRDGGNELAVELTLAGYVANDSLSRRQVEQISELIKVYYRTYEQLYARRDVGTEQALRWILDVLAVEVESLINDHYQDMVFVEFAYSQLSQSIDEKVVFGKTIDDFAAALYVAVHQALLKSDRATVRANLIKRYQVSVENIDDYVNFNQRLDKLIDSAVTDKLYREVDRQGAPLRIIRRMIDERSDLDQLLAKRDSFLDEFEKQVNKEYERVSRRINRAIVRSVIFLIITKFLIGLAIEIPYDYWAHGGIIWLPLIINLLFPPIYMVALRATHRLPGYANTKALIERVDNMLYGDKLSLSSIRRPRGFGPIFSLLYVITGLLVFGAMLYLLLWLQFSLVHIAIFFVFLSAASFLGFRLSRLIRELEVVRSAQNGMTFVRDLLYLPFVVVGQWMSDKYSKVNIVTIVLDMLIELPLKTVLRLVRQWGAFIDERKDRL